MSPAVMRLIFGGFALVLAGVAGNALLLQPDASARFAAAHAVTSAPRAVASTPTLAPPQALAPPPTVRAEATAPSQDAPRAVVAAATKDEPLRVARLTTDSARVAILPRLPETESDPDVTLRAQRELATRGYGPVVPNGIIGPLTRAAVMAYEFDHAMPLTGEANEALVKRMREGPGGNRTPHPDARKIRSPEAEQVVRTIQHSLTTLNFEPGRVNGRLGEETERAIRAFEAHVGMQPTGRVSAELFSHLARAMGARSSRAP